MVVAVCLTLAEACLQSKFHEAHGPNVGRGRRGTIGISRHRLIHAGFFTGFNHDGLSRAPLVEISPLIAALRPPAPRPRRAGESPAKEEGGPKAGPPLAWQRLQTAPLRGLIETGTDNASRNCRTEQFRAIPSTIGIIARLFLGAPLDRCQSAG